MFNLPFFNPIKRIKTICKPSSSINFHKTSPTHKISQSPKNRDNPTTCNNPSARMIGAFSMLELVFVIVILGILAAIAIPRFSLTRVDAQVISIESDITNAFSAVQREVFSQNIDPTTLDSAAIFRLAGLSNARWIISADKIVLASSGAVDTQNGCVSIFASNGELVFELTQKADSNICTKLNNRHPNGGERAPLNTSNAVF